MPPIDAEFTESVFRKRLLQNFFILVALILLILPAITTFNEVLTSLVMRFQFYRSIQEYVVPFQAKMVTVVIRGFGIVAYPTTTGVNLGNGNVIGRNVVISWNCIGWQSLILFVLTLVTGLQGPYSRMSKFQTIFIGTLGIILMNILRVSLVVIIAYYVGQTAGVIFHNYFSTVMTIAWLFLFWWFSFTYVLQRKAKYGPAL